MAYTAAEKLLIELVNKGTLSFNESDLKGERNQSKRKLLYTLGAYKGVQIDRDVMGAFGLKPCKKMVDALVPINVYNYVHMFEQDSYEAFYNITQMDAIAALENENYWRIKSGLKNLATWKGIRRGKDVFIHGIGSFNIDEAYAKAVKNNSSVYYMDNVVSLMDIRCAGYFPDCAQRFYLAELYKHSIDLFKWVYVNNYPLGQLDELKDLNVLGLFDYSFKLDTVMSRINDMVDRDLRLSWVDNTKFDYPDKLKLFAEQNGFTIPKNGIDLKKQARVFSNCSGGYVRKILDKKSFIIYNEEEMLEIKGANVLQHLGKRNTLVEDSRRNYIQGRLAS